MIWVKKMFLFTLYARTIYYYCGELKTKPTQHSIKELRSIGIQPDAVVCRSDRALTQDVRAK